MSKPLNIRHFNPTTWWKKVDVQGPDDCWLWLQSRGSHGYGQTWDGVTVRLSHRVAWSLTNGPIPDGLTIDHLCFVRPCCNPRHMELVTVGVNAQRARQRIISCPHGHPYDEENTAFTRRGSRVCRTCAREGARRRYHINKMI